MINAFIPWTCEQLIFSQLLLTLTTLKYFCKNHGDHRYILQFEILVSSFRFIRVTILWVYDRYNFGNSLSAGILDIRDV